MAVMFVRMIFHENNSLTLEQPGIKPILSRLEQIDDRSRLRYLLEVEVRAFARDLFGR